MSPLLASMRYIFQLLRGDVPANRNRENISKNNEIASMSRECAARYQEREKVPPEPHSKVMVGTHNHHVTAAAR
jgi:hypothetical protein